MDVWNRWKSGEREKGERISCELLDGGAGMCLKRNPNIYRLLTGYQCMNLSDLIIDKPQISRFKCAVTIGEHIKP